MKPEVWIKITFPVILVLHSGLRVASDAGDSPLEFTYDRTDGRLVWISNKTSEIVQKIEYRRLFQTENGSSQSVNNSWQQIAYDPHWPGWQKPDGICAEYELNVMTTDEKSYTQTLRAPIPTFKSESKIRPARVYFDPIRNRVMAELVWGNNFDYWTAAGAVIIGSVPWIKLVSCQSLFKNVVPPPTMENGGTLWSFDPEYARNNCTFLFGVNGTLQMMQVPAPFNPAPQLMHEEVINGQLTPVPVAPSTQQQSIDQNCSKIDFSTSISNESILLNLTCDTVSGASAICVAPQRQCTLDCSPAEIRAYNMQDNGDYLKIDWHFSNSTMNEIKRFQVRYALANVTPWNTVFSEQEPTELTLQADQNYVEIKNFPARADNSANLTIQICGNLNQVCTAPIQWDQEKKYAVSYVLIPVASANLVSSANSRRRSKNGATTACKKSGNVVVAISLIFFMSLHIDD